MTGSRSATRTAGVLRMVLAVALGVVVTLATAGCSVRASRSQAAPPGGGRAGAAGPTTAHPAAPWPAGDTVHTLSVGGRERRYLLHLPATSPPDRPGPLLLAFHPGYATAAGFARTTDFSARAGALGYVVAYPDGIQRSWNAGDCCGPPAREGVDDVAFALAVVDDVAATVPIDRNRVFATGFSNGAALVYLLACRAADRVRAIVVGGSALHIPPDECRPARPVPVLAFHGLADPVAPFQGGQSLLKNIGSQPAVLPTIARWSAIDGCGSPPRLALRQGQATRYTTGSCHDSAEVVLWTVAGMGHQWPGGEPYDQAQFGPTSRDISATDLALEFFQRYRKA